jgi:hypothetical protein
VGAWSESFDRCHNTILHLGDIVLCKVMSRGLPFAYLSDEITGRLFRKQAIVGEKNRRA